MFLAINVFLLDIVNFTVASRLWNCHGKYEHEVKKVHIFHQLFLLNFSSFACSVDSLFLNPWPIFKSLFFLLSRINIAKCMFQVRHKNVYNLKNTILSTRV